MPRRVGLPDVQPARWGWRLDSCPFARSSRRWSCSSSSPGLPPGALAVEYDEERHADGSLHYRIRPDREGQRHGDYVRYHPSGDPEQEGPRAESGTYQSGQLHGVVAALPEDRRGPTDPDVLVAVLTRLNHYRLLCGLSTGVGYDVQFSHRAQCAAEVCAALDKLTHRPGSNPGLDEERWQAGKTGCTKSNLAMGDPSAIDAWMDDSDRSNRAQVGRLRWLLWPELTRFGFGQSGRYAAGYVIDGGGGSADVPVVAFPPRGLMPTDLFRGRFCWHASPDPDRYRIGKGAKIEILPYDARSGRTGEPIPLQFETVAEQKLGGRPAIIAQPEGFQPQAGSMWQVTVSGVEKSDADAPDLEWVTIFY